MPSARALRLCPELVFLRPRFAPYRAISQDIRAVFREYTQAIERLSLDEAYLDVTGISAYGGSATRIARAIKSGIREQTGLTASAGVSYNKFLAKLASDQDKPDGLYVVTPEAGADFVAGLEVRRFHGIGPATAARLNALGVQTGADLRAWSREDLVARFGRAGERYYDLARGIDERPVETSRVRKSVGQENTFAQDMTALAEMEAELERLAAQVATRLQELGRADRTLTVKVRFAVHADHAQHHPAPGFRPPRGHAPRPARAPTPRLRRRRRRAAARCNCLQPRRTSGTARGALGGGVNS